MNFFRNLNSNLLPKAWFYPQNASNCLNPYCIKTSLQVNLLPKAWSYCNQFQSQPNPYLNMQNLQGALQPKAWYKSQNPYFNMQFINGSLDNSAWNSYDSIQSLENTFLHDTLEDASSNEQSFLNPYHNSSDNSALYDFQNEQHFPNPYHKMNSFQNQNVPNPYHNLQNFSQDMQPNQFYHPNPYHNMQLPNNSIDNLVLNDIQSEQNIPNPYHNQNMQHLQNYPQDWQYNQYYQNTYNSFGNLPLIEHQNEQNIPNSYNNIQNNNFSLYSSQDASIDSFRYNQSYPNPYQNTQIISDNKLNMNNNEYSYHNIQSLTNYFSKSTDLDTQNDSQTYLNPYHNIRTVSNSLGPIQNFSPSTCQFRQTLQSSYGNENLFNFEKNAEQYSLPVHRNLEPLSNCLLPKAYINSRLLQSTNWLQKPFGANFLSKLNSNSPLNIKFKRQVCSNYLMPVLKQCFLRGFPNPYFNMATRHAVYA